MAQAAQEPNDADQRQDAAAYASSAQESPAQTPRRAWGWLAAYVVVALMAVGLAMAAHNQPILPGDLGVTRALQTVVNPAVFDLLYGVSSIGYAVLSSAITVVVLLILALLRR